MQKRRTQYFKLTFLTVLGASALFLLILAAFGGRLAAHSFNLVADSIFAVMALATVSFLAFSFLPYFRGDKRWYAISGLLTVAFFSGATILWQLPVGVA